MDARRLGADEQLLRDLAVRPPGRDQGQDLRLARRQAELRERRAPVGDDADSAGWLPGPSRARLPAPRRTPRGRRRPGAPRRARPVDRGQQRAAPPAPAAAAAASRARPPRRPGRPRRGGASAARNRAYAAGYGIGTAAHVSAAAVHAAGVGRDRPAAPTRPRTGRRVASAGPGRRGRRSPRSPSARSRAARPGLLRRAPGRPAVDVRARARRGRRPPGARPRRAARRAPCRHSSRGGRARPSPPSRPLAVPVVDRQLCADELDEGADVGVDLAGGQRRRPREPVARPLPVAAGRQEPGHRRVAIERADPAPPALQRWPLASASASSQRPARDRASIALAWKCGPKRRSRP